MARRVVQGRGLSYQPPPPSPVEPYPQHAKIYPFTQENWVIREFMSFLRRKEYIDPVLDHDMVNSLLLQFRGVDEAAYEAESADMRHKYQWLWSKYDRGPVVAKDPEPAVVPEVVREQVKQDDGLSLLMAQIRGGKDGTATQG